MMFQCSNCNMVPFLYYIKNELEISHFFTNACDLYYILLYISFDFLFYNCIFYSPLKNMLITPTY